MAFKSATSATSYAHAKAAKDAQVEGGTVVNGGNIDTDVGPIKNQVEVNALRPDTKDETVGGKVIELTANTGSTTDRVGVTKAYSEGTFAYNSNDHVTHGTTWVVQGGNVTKKLSGVEVDNLRQGANGGAPAAGTEVVKISDRLGSNPHASGDINVLARPSTEITPGFTKWVTAGDALTFVNPTDGSAAVVSEIKSTRSVPGELVYHFGGAGGPQTDDYKAKDAYEQLDGSS